MSNEIKQAFELGRKAFHNGINAPVNDPEMQAMIKPEVGSNIGNLSAWMKGWTIEMINAPIAI